MGKVNLQDLYKLITFKQNKSNMQAYCTSDIFDRQKTSAGKINKEKTTTQTIKDTKVVPRPRLE